jgi:hypothetical protein
MCFGHQRLLVKMRVSIVKKSRAAYLAEEINEEDYTEREKGDINREKIKPSQTLWFVSADITGLSPLFAFCSSI